jgi:L-ascorbate metabolism protein UlaG (beta-lactamase superfamily)
MQAAIDEHRSRSATKFDQELISQPLIEDGGETVLHAGDCATFPKGTGNGHHLINRSDAMAVYLEVGSRNPQAPLAPIST